MGFWHALKQTIETLRSEGLTNEQVVRSVYEELRSWRHWVSRRWPLSNWLETNLDRRLDERL